MLRLVQRYVRPFAVAESIGLEHEVDAFSCIYEIEGGGPAKSARADGAVVALVAASPSHIKFVNRDVLLHVRNFDVHGQERTAHAERPEEETAERAAAVDQRKFTFHQPANPRSFV